MTEPEKQEPAVAPGSSSSSLRAAAGASTNGTGHEDDAVDRAPESAGEAERVPDADSDAAKAQSPEADAKNDKKKEAPLLAAGNPLRWLRGGATAAIGSILAFLLMAHDAQLRLGVPLGMLFIAVAAWGLMDLVGSFDDPDERLASSMTLRSLAPSIGRAVVGTLLFFGSIMGGQASVGPQWLWGFLVTASFLLWVGTVYALGVKLGPWSKDELGLERPLMRRHGFWVLAAGACLYFPCLGLYSLWDPWETHYGEVAREILARDDWISLWWAQDGWFWSKPILNFWIQSIAMAALGTNYQGDQMLLNGAGQPTLHPEWVVRTPNVLFTLLAMYILYKGVAKVFGRRAGLLGALVLATMPDWYFLAHQTMTDMPCVSMMTAAMGCLLLGVHSAEHQVARVYEVKVGKTAWRLSAWHLVFGAVLVSALPQILYLFSRNLELVLHGPGPHGFRPHWDEFHSGSKGNCGLPGNENCILTNPAQIPKSIQPHPDTFGGAMTRLFGAFEPVLQGLLWSVLIGFALYLNWGERRVRRLFYIAAWYFAAIATMGKGPEGVVIPGMCAFAWVCTKRKWSELLQLEVVTGLLLVWAAISLPWFVAMYMRHGSPFTDRLIFHDMFNRAFHHVHDTNEGDDTSIRFYIWQMGYAFFPWTGIAPLGLMYWLRRSDSYGKGKGDVVVFLFMWFLFAFALVSFMGTKFHHYIFPAIPAVAMLIGIALDQMLEGEEPQAQGSRVMYLVGTFAGVLLSIAGIARMLPGSIFGTKEIHGELPAGSAVVGGLLLAVGLVVIGVFVTFYRRRDGREPEEADPRTMHERTMLGAAALAGALALALVGRDLIVKPEGADQPGAIRLLQLFTYNYRRSWPESLDFSAVLVGLTAVAALATLALASWRWRRHAVYAMTAVAVACAVWGLDVYMVKTAPHWGQHETIQAYYANRTGPEEPLVAYQMNWKGENFYTGNHIPAFVSTGATFTNWLKAEREKGVKVMFFVTEHSRVGGLKSEVQGKNYKELTDKALDNKFVMVRAEL